MSPLLFLAIAVVVPLLGMVVLGVGARMKRNRVTDDETEPFRRKLKSIAPRGPEDAPRAPGLRGLFRRGSGPRAVPSNVSSAGDDSSDDAPTPDRPRSDIPAPRPRTAKSIRLIEREYSLPALPPLSADREDWQPRRARSRPTGDHRGNRSGT